MRILLLAPNYPPVLGGAELQAQRLARAFDETGIRVTVLTRPCRGQAAEDSERGVRIVRRLDAIELGPLWGLSFIRSTGRWLRQLADDWDIVHNQQVGLHSWASVRTARDLRRPCLLRFACSGENGDLGVLRRRRFGSRLVSGLRAASRFVALTGGGAAEIAHHGLPPERIRTIPNGIDPAEFPGQAWPATDARSAVRLLFVGRMDHQKGLDILLDALALVPDRARFALRAIGAGPELEALRTRARVAGLGHIVEFLGSLADVRAFYAWSEVVVFPSRFEGMPNVVLEAFASGRPVLGTQIDGTADLVRHGANGWLVPSADPRALADALIGIERGRQELPVLGAQGRRAVEAHYSLRHAAALYAGEYEAMLAERA